MATHPPSFPVSRPVIFDATALLSGQGTAIDRMLAADLTPPSGAIVVGRRGVAPVPLTRIESALQRAGVASEDEADDPALRDTVAWLLGTGEPPPPPAQRSCPWLERHAVRLAERSAIPGVMPGGNIFVRVGLQGWGDANLDRWIESRPDLVPVAIVDDLWALDHPEYCPGETATTMRRRFDSLARSVRALVVPTDVARRRAEAILGEPGRHGITLHVVPPPSEIADTGAPAFSAALANVPFVVVAGPFEARNNLPLLLTLWRERVVAGRQPPKLVLAGHRGTQIEEIRPLLDWNENLRPYLWETERLRPQGLRTLLAHASAIVAPDFAAGSGALVRDAQAIDTPVIASTIPTFREVLSPEACFLHPLDGSGWMRSINALRVAGQRSPVRKMRMANWSTYRAALQAIVANL